LVTKTVPRREFLLTIDHDAAAVKIGPFSQFSPLMWQDRGNADGHTNALGKSHRIELSQRGFPKSRGNAILRQASRRQAMTVTRYHPVLVVLHWLVAIMISWQLGFGYFVIRSIPNSDSAKLGPLGGHMGLGTAVIALMVIRLIMRYFTSHPEPTASQREGIGTLRTPIHWLLYLVIFVTALSGWYTGFLIAHLYEVPGNTLPADFAQYPTRVVHVWMALVLFLLILLHIAAAIKERATGDKNILSRVWFGKRLG
jgi:cytochrome b561